MQYRTKGIDILIHGSSKEIERFYNKNFPSVKSFILRNKGSVEDAEDIFHRGILQVTVRYRKDPFEIKSSFEAYLFTVCKNLWRRELNKSKKQVTTQSNMQHIDENEDLARSILEQKRWELFTENLELISENCRLILNLFFAKVPYANIVEKLKYSSETVARQRVFKCKRKLKELIISDKRYNLLKNI